MSKPLSSTERSPVCQREASMSGLGSGGKHQGQPSQSLSDGLILIVGYQGFLLPVTAITEGSLKLQLNSMENRASLQLFPDSYRANIFFLKQ